LFPSENRHYVSAEVSLTEKGLSIQDRRILIAAHKLHATFLTADNLIRKTSLQHNIPVHGLIWIIQKMIEKELLDPDET